MDNPRPIWKLPASTSVKAVMASPPSMRMAVVRWLRVTLSWPVWQAAQVMSTTLSWRVSS